MEAAADSPGDDGVWSADAKRGERDGRFAARARVAPGQPRVSARELTPPIVAVTCSTGGAARGVRVTESRRLARRRVSGQPKLDARTRSQTGVSPLTSLACRSAVHCVSRVFGCRPSPRPRRMGSTPPDWTPEGGSASLSARLGKKAKAGSLGKRASKLGEGTLTVRFEMPFDVRCLGCDGTIARGVRFNAHARRRWASTTPPPSGPSPCARRAVRATSGFAPTRNTPSSSSSRAPSVAGWRRKRDAIRFRARARPRGHRRGRAPIQGRARGYDGGRHGAIERQGRLAAASNPAAGSGAPNLPRRCDASRDSARIDGRTITRPTASFGARCARTVKPSPRDGRARRWVYPSVHLLDVRPPTPTPREPRFGIR